jgi:hypothetical protein
MSSNKKDTKKEVKKAGYKLIGDFPTNKKKYKTGDTIQLTVEGATYLRKLKKIK